MKIFGIHFLKDSEHKKLSESYAKSLEFLASSITISDQLKSVTNELEALKILRPKVDTDIGDPSPVDVEQRKLYVAAVAGLHKDYLSPKLLQMISTSNRELSDMGNSRDLDLTLKGVIYAFWEINRWGNQMIGEYIENQISPTQPEEEKDKVERTKIY